MRRLLIMLCAITVSSLLLTSCGGEVRLEYSGEKTPSPISGQLMTYERITAEGELTFLCSLGVDSEGNSEFLAGDRCYRSFVDGEGTVSIYYKDSSVDWFLSEERAAPLSMEYKATVFYNYLNRYHDVFFEGSYELIGDVDYLGRNCVEFSVKKTETDENGDKHKLKLKVLIDVESGAFIYEEITDCKTSGESIYNVGDVIRCVVTPIDGEYTAP